MWEGLTDKNKTMGTKVRLAQVYRKDGQTTMGIMTELKELNEADIADFKGWFEAAGFPCT